MKNKPKKPFLPFISVEQILNFDRNRPDTFTESRLINELCIAFEKVGTASAKAVAEYMDLDPVSLSHAVRIITGQKLTQLREIISIHRIKKLAQTESYKDANELARKAGYADRSALYRLLGRKDYDQLIALYVRH